MQNTPRNTYANQSPLTLRTIFFLIRLAGTDNSYKLIITMGDRGEVQRSHKIFESAETSYFENISRATEFAATYCQTHKDLAGNRVAQREHVSP